MRDIGRFHTRRRTNRLIFVRLKRRFFQDELPVETNKSTTAATAAQTGITKFSDSRSWNLSTIDPRHQKYSPNRRFLPGKSLLHLCSVAAILLLEHNLNLVPVLFALKCTDLCSHSPGSMNLRQTMFQHMAVWNSNSTNKCQTICPSRRFVRPLV